MKVSTIAAAFLNEQNTARRPLYNPLIHRTAPALYSFTFARPVMDAAARAALASALQAPAPTWQYTAAPYNDNSALTDSVLQLAAKAARASFKFLAQKDGGKQWQDLYTAAHNYYKTGHTDNNDVMDVIQIAALAIMETAHAAAPLASNYSFEMFVKYGILPNGALFTRTYTKKDKTQVTLYGRRALQSYATIAVNKYINKQRQNAARGLVSVEKMQESLQDSYTAAPAAKCANLQEVETLQAISQVLGGKKALQYQIVLAVSMGYTQKEIATKTGYTQGYIAQQLAKARAALFNNGIAPKTLKK